MLRVEWEVGKERNYEKCWVTSDNSGITGICQVDTYFWEVTKMIILPKQLVVDCIPWEANWNRGECAGLWLGSAFGTEWEGWETGLGGGRTELWWQFQRSFQPTPWRAGTGEVLHLSYVGARGSGLYTHIKLIFGLGCPWKKVRQYSLAKEISKDSLQPMTIFPQPSQQPGKCVLPSWRMIWWHTIES